MSLFGSGLLQSRSWSEESAEFCRAFFRGDKPRYILGRNVYGASVAKQIGVEGFIDDFANELTYLGLPILRAIDTPPDALVLNAAGGRPLTAKRWLDSLGLRNLDYFAFSVASGLTLRSIRFNEGFREDFLEHQKEYEWIRGLLEDKESVRVFDKLVNFRNSLDISYLEGFAQREAEQYFEDFLGLRSCGETFVDVGAFDGFTSLEFIRRCPEYAAIHAFEPDPKNFQTFVSALGAFPRVTCYPIGLSEHSSEVCFDAVGSSSSKACVEGEIKIRVERLDDLMQGVTPTFLKMDIEGGEGAALSGATETILANRPRLAISVYHSAGDFWKIPAKILSIFPGYKILVRHYTESIYETVMFFLPADKKT